VPRPCQTADADALTPIPQRRRAQEAHATGPPPTPGEGGFGAPGIAIRRCSRSARLASHPVGAVAPRRGTSPAGIGPSADALSGGCGRRSPVLPTAWRTPGCCRRGRTPGGRTTRGAQCRERSLLRQVSPGSRQGLPRLEPTKTRGPPHQPRRRLGGASQMRPKAAPERGCRGRRALATHHLTSH
jgi:hypothetical protein